MERPRPSTIAWGTLAAGVLAYDYFCPDGEQMSERADEWVEHPIKHAAFATILGATALHLLNRIDPKYDFLHHLGKLKPTPEIGRN